MSFESSRPLPSQRKLILATGVALLVAAVVLVVTVLPAEYGIDPTGLGGRLGLTALAHADAAEPEPEAATAPAPTPAESPMPAPPATAASTVVRRTTAPVTEATTVTLLPGKGVEIKAHMKAGDQFVFEWTASAPVGSDMHGERDGAAKDEYTSYWLDKTGLASASGAFTAPFDGVHGWYWHNASTEPVTVDVKITGFIVGKLYRP